MTTPVAGSVTVAKDESRTGSGMALSIYDRDVATTVLPDVPSLGNPNPPWNATIPVSQFDVDTIKDARLAVLRERARQATAYAEGVINYLREVGCCPQDTGPGPG